MEVRLLFIGLWTLADRAGRLEDRPKQIKMDVFPADSVDVDASLNQIGATGMLTRYEIDGKRYIQITNFAKHQNPHRDEKASTLPDMNGNTAESESTPSKHGASTVQARCKGDGDTVAIGLTPESRSLIPDSLIPEEEDTGFGMPASQAAKVCLVVKAEGIGSVNPGHPKLVELLSDGAEVADFIAASKVAVGAGKGFAYMLGVVKGIREDAKRAPKQAPQTLTFAERDRIAGMQRWEVDCNRKHPELPDEYSKFPATGAVIDIDSKALRIAK